MSGCRRRRRLIKTLLGVASLVASTSGFLLGTFHSHQTTLRSGSHTDPIMVAKSSNNDEDKAIIDLQLHTIRQDPAATLTSLSEACKALEIESFDVYGDYQSNPQQSYLRRFESEVARRFGKDDAVFCLSGGMAQSIALMIHANSHSSSNGRSDVRAFVCHPTSHLILHENNAYSELLDMEAVLTADNFKENGRLGMAPMSLSDVNNILSSDDATLVTYPTQKPITCNDISTLMLELPHREIGGKLTPWDEVRGMSTLCKEKGIKFHCDGARIFEASAGYEHETLAQTAEPFDSVYVSFYKGVGAVSGAMLLGDSAFIGEARVWLRRFGGNLYSVMPYAVSCWDGFRKNCVDDVFVERRRKLARVIDMLNVDKNVQSIVQFEPTVPKTSMIHGYLKASLDDCKKALSMVEARTGIRVLTRLSKINDDDASSTPFGCRFEWSMGTSNVLIDDEDFLLGWQEFSRALDEIPFLSHKTQTNNNIITMNSAAVARVATRSLARRSSAALTKQQQYSTSVAVRGGATPPLAPFARIPPESEKLVEHYDAIWDDGVAPEVTLDFDCQHISAGEGLAWWLGGLGFFATLFQVVKATDPESKNPAVNRVMNRVGGNPVELGGWKKLKEAE